VFGQGPLGCLLAMVARARQARVLMVGRGGWRFERVRALGLGECLDAAGSADLVGDIRARTQGRGAEVTVDATGQPEVWEQAVAASARGGTVLFFGGCAPGTDIRLDTRRVHYEELTLLGAFHHTPDAIRRAVAMLESGALVPDGLITHRMGLEGVTEALQLMASSAALKVLIEPSSSRIGA
ncbi:MAG: zinc-binding dehydrogenase, partial [Candidatus Rokuibacteriota bacterium]